jgi:hypothetical protein
LNIYYMFKFYMGLLPLHLYSLDDFACEKILK